MLQLAVAGRVLRRIFLKGLRKLHEVGSRLSWFHNGKALQLKSFFRFLSI
jgi:hypothetical protein